MTVFFDTNIMVYTIVKGDARQPIAAQLLSAGGSLSIQVLNEFASVAHRKLRLDWPDVAAALSAIRSLVAAPVPLTLALHVKALDLAERHKFALYDAMIVAAALSIGSDVLYSEDMGDGMRVDGTLTIVNPFKSIVPVGNVPARSGRKPT